MPEEIEQLHQRIQQLEQDNARLVNMRRLQFEDIVNSQGELLRKTYVELSKRTREKDYLLETVQLGVLIFSEDLTITSVNATALTMLQCERENVIGTSIQEILSSENENVGNKSFYKAIRHADSFIAQMLECQACRADGQCFPVEVALSQSKEENHTHFVACLQDITDRKQKELFQQRLVAIINGTPDAIVTFDFEGNIFFINDGGRDIMGISANEDISKRKISSFFPQSEIDKILNEAVPTAFMNRIWQGETCLITIDGRVMDVSQIMVMHKISEDTAPYFSIIMRDITELKEAERKVLEYTENLEKIVEERTRELVIAKEQAEEANRAKSRFLNNITHELRTPLHAVISFSDLGFTKIETAPMEKIKGYFSKIKISGHTLLRLVNDLLDLAKMESKMMEYKKVEIFLPKLCDEVADEFTALLDKKQMSLHKEYQENSPACLADPDRIKQVIRNLTSNAYKFSPANSALTLQVTHANNLLTFAVSDEGTGIPQGELEKIFETFVQCKTTKVGTSGTGLGLSISREIIDAHEGKIWAENNKKTGARFLFSLPLPNQSG